MSKVVYTKDISMSVNGIEGVPSILIKKPWYYGELPKDELFVTSNFEKVKEYANGVYGVFTSQTMFRKIPYIAIVLDGFYDEHIKKIKKEEFEDFSKTIIYKEISHKYTIQDLSERLSAEDFAEWLKDHGIGCKISEFIGS